MSHRPANPSLDALAGGLAGIATKTVMAPVDRVKLLLQTQRAVADSRAHYTGVIDCFRRIRREEGLLAFRAATYVLTINTHLDLLALSYITSTSPSASTPTHALRIFTLDHALALTDIHSHALLTHLDIALADSPI